MRLSTLIRHQVQGPAPSVGPLSIAVVQPALWALLVTLVGLTQLLAPSFLLAGLAAITLAPITCAADPEPYSASSRPAETMTEDTCDRS
jgi:hypothetical protein